MILLTPKREGLVLGDFDVETSLLFVLVVFERAEDELELKLAAVVPLRTMVVGAKEELLELFCTEIDLVWDRRKSILLEEMHKHEDCSSSWRMHLSQRLDCPELGIHKVEVCD